RGIQPEREECDDEKKNAYDHRKDDSFGFRLHGFFARMIPPRVSVVCYDSPVTSPHSPAGKFSSLLDISRRINSEKNFDKLIEIIATEATQLIHAERATVFMFDKAKSELWTRTGTGVSDTMRYDARYGIAGAVLIAGKTLTVEDAQ